MRKFFNLNRLNAIKKEDFLSEEEKEAIEENTFGEIEKALEELKKEEEKARNQLVEELKNIFKDLPIVL